MDAAAGHTAVHRRCAGGRVAPPGTHRAGSACAARAAVPVREGVLVMLPDEWVRVAAVKASMAAAAASGTQMATALQAMGLEAHAVHDVQITLASLISTIVPRPEEDAGTMRFWLRRDAVAVHVAVVVPRAAWHPLGAPDSPPAGRSVADALAGTRARVDGVRLQFGDETATITLTKHVGNGRARA